MTPRELLARFDIIAEAPQGIARLRELVLQIAVRGRLVPQDPHDEPASELVRRIAAEKSRAIRAGQAPRLRITDLPRSAKPRFEVPPKWAWILLDNLCVYVQRGKSPRYDDHSPVRVISQKCIQWAGFDLSRARGVSEESLAGYGPERFLRQGDLLWNSTGRGTVGRVNVYPGTPQGTRAVADSHVTVIRPAVVDPSYLYCWIASRDVQSRMGALTSGSTNQQELSATTVRGISVPLPPLPEQHRIVSRVGELMSLLDRLELHLRKQREFQDAFAAAAVHQMAELQWGDQEKRYAQLFTDSAFTSTAPRSDSESSSTLGC